MHSLITLAQLHRHRQVTSKYEITRSEQIETLPQCPATTALELTMIDTERILNMFATEEIQYPTC